MKILNISPGKITPYERNAKQHDERQISNVAESIKQFGFAQPLVVDKDNVLIIGHCRLIAAKRLHMKTVPVVRMDELLPEEVDKLRLLDNKLNESPWDFELLAEDIPELDWTGFDIDWELPDIDFGIVEDVIEDEVPEPPKKAKSKEGEVYQLGNHRLMCGDSTKPEDVKTLMNGDKADMVFTDPPWNVNYGAMEEGNPQGYKPRTILNDFMGTEDFKKFMYETFKCMNEASKGGVHDLCGNVSAGVGKYDVNTCAERLSLVEHHYLE